MIDPTRLIFIHGLEGSSQGVKATLLRGLFPGMSIPDFRGSLGERMAALNEILGEQDGWTIVGSSFGGLMGACLALEQPERVQRLILLAPALNFHEFRVPEKKIDVDTLLVIGSDDVVTPPDIVVPAAEATFANLQLNIVDDDHLLHNTYQNLDWPYLLR